MKLLIFSHDESIMSMAQDLESLEWASCANVKEAIEFVKQWREEDQQALIVCLLDFEVGLKAIDEFSKKHLKDKWLIRIGLAPGESLKDLRAHQKSKTAAHGYLVKPLNVVALESMINDHETALYVQNNDLLDEGADIGEIQLTKLESRALKELGGLDQDKEDYDTTHPGMVLPKDFAKSVEATMTSEIDVPDHASQLAHFKNDPVHKKIQKIFDQVFSYGAKERPIGVGQSLELPPDDELDEFSAAAPAVSEDAMSTKKEDDLDIGLEFDMTDEEQVDDSEASDERISAKSENESEEDLGFSFEEDSAEEGLVIGESTGERQNINSVGNEDDQAANEFSFDVDEPLEQSDELAASNVSSDEGDEEEASTGGFDLSFDEEEGSEGLDIGGQTDDFGSETQAEDHGLDLGDEDDGDLSFSLGGAENSGEVLEAQSGVEQDDGFGDLGLDDDDNDADPTVLGTSADLLKNAELSSDDVDQDSLIGENTLDKVDKTISEIILGGIDSPSKKTALSDEDTTGEFDLPEGLPSELTEDMLSEESTDSQEFSLTDDEFEASSVGEATNPTVVTTTQGLKKEQSRPKVEVENEDELFAFDTGGQESASLEELVDQEEEDFSFGEELANPEKTKATAVIPDSVEAKNLRTPRTLSHVSDDELLRLQGTIRQLREEREEHLKEIQELKKEVKLVEQGGLSNKAELDEAKIEISILKKRHKTEIEELRYQLKLADERKQIFEERCKNYQKEFDRLNQKVRIEFNQVKQREKELESQLELVTMDTEAQVQARDGKILELKRKIDALEFNMENATIREQKSRDDKMRLEERLHKIMTTLRGSIKVLEEDHHETDISSLEVDSESHEKKEK